MVKLKTRPARLRADSADLLPVRDTPTGLQMADACGVATSTNRLRAICEQAPATLPQIKLDLSKEEEEEISASALAALRRLQALWVVSDA